MARKMSKKQRTRQMILRGILVLALAAAGLTVAYTLIFGGRVEINLNDRTHAILSGSNGGGTLTAEVDGAEEYEDFFDSVVVSFSKSEGLSNQDEVEVSYSYDRDLAKEYHLKVVADDEFIVIRDLPDTSELAVEDMFEGVSVSFDGIAPLCTATLEFEGNSFGSIFSYQIVNAKEYYDLGDEVTVRAIFDEDKLFDAGYTPETPSEECLKTFQVSGVDAYITSADEITDEMLSSLEAQALTLFTDANEYGMRIFCDAGLVPVYINKKCTFEWVNPTLLSSYLYVVRDDKVGELGTHVNDIKFCYEAYITQADNTTCKCEAIVRFEDIYIKADGTVELNLESGEIISADRRDKNIKNVLDTDNDDEYVSTKLM